MLYVGSLSESKGVGDAIRAVSILQKRHFNCSLTVIGAGDLNSFEKLTAELGLGETVKFLGLKSHPFVLSAMHDHDVVLVPSRWAYPEGLPMTLYEALCTHTPLITSNHPMFSIKIRDRQNALVFPEQDVQLLADRIQELATSPELYANLSAASFEAAEHFLLPLKYDRLISDFLDANGRTKLRAGSLDRLEHNGAERDS